MDANKIKTNRTFRLSIQEQDDLREISLYYGISQNQLMSQAIRRLFLKYQTERMKQENGEQK